MSLSSSCKDYLEQSVCNNTKNNGNPYGIGPDSCSRCMKNAHAFPPAIVGLHCHDDQKKCDTNPNCAYNEEISQMCGQTCDMLLDNAECDEKKKISPNQCMQCAVDFWGNRQGGCTLPLVHQYCGAERYMYSRSIDCDSYLETITRARETEGGVTYNTCMDKVIDAAQADPHTASYLCGGMVWDPLSPDEWCTQYANDKCPTETFCTAGGFAGTCKTCTVGQHGCGGPTNPEICLDRFGKNCKTGYCPGYKCDETTKTCEAVKNTVFPTFKLCSGYVGTACSTGV